MALVASISDRVGDLGGYLREQREHARLSVRQLASLAGVSNPYLSQVERGLRKPSAEVLQQIARGLRISAEALYVRAGILDDEGRPDVEAAVQADPDLNERQRRVLLDIYASFRAENRRTTEQPAPPPAARRRVAATTTRATVRVRSRAAQVAGTTGTRRPAPETPEPGLQAPDAVEATASEVPAGPARRATKRATKRATTRATKVARSAPAAGEPPPDAATPGAAPAVEAPADDADG